MDELEKKAQEIETSIKEAKNESAEVKKELQEVKKSMEDSKTDIEKKFNNVDESLKEFKKAVEQKEEKKEMTAEMAFKQIIESAEFKGGLADLKAGKSARFVTEVKTSTSAITGDVNRTVQNTTIYGPSFAALSFLNRLPRYTIGQDKNRVVYCNASFTDNTDYVGEGAAVATANTGSVVEKYREVAKIGSKLEFTAEMMSDANYFLNWLRNQSILAINAKVDSLAWNGDGADGSNAKHIYGIKGAATAFDADAAGHKGKIENADVYALLLACKSQIELATNGAYTPNTVFVHPAEYTRMRNLRDANGNQISIADVKAFLGCEVVPTTRLSAGEALVIDINAVQLHEKLGFELEVERIASTDSYAMHLRWRGNIVIPDEAKKAVVYVANIDTAIAAIAKA
jgi:HK97 family phage major capsid protein